MKKIFLVVALVATAWIKPVFAQNSQTQSLLASYYDIKNALVNSDATLAASTRHATPPRLITKRRNS